MRVVVSGGTGFIGRSVLPALIAADHEVVVTHRHPDQAASILAMGATPAVADLLDVDSLAVAFSGADAVVNLASDMPVGHAALRPGAWRGNDRLCVIGVRNLVEAARRAGVRRLVQHSSSLLYADGNESWITESSPLGITTATEPVSVAEAHVQGYTCRSRAGVLLRLGRVIGDDPLTQRLLRAGGRGRPLGLGDPAGWIHVVHADDLGPAVLAALHAPSGAYNVGAEPVRRGELLLAYADRGRAGASGVLGPLMRRLAGTRLEPLSRSLRVSSERFTAETGWHPRRPRFAAGWLAAAAAELTPTAAAARGTLGSGGWGDPA